MPKNPEFALTLPLVLLCLLLGSIVILESLFFQRPSTGGARDLGATGRDVASEAGEPDAPFELPPLDAFSAFVDRPLFTEGRRPAIETEQTEAPKEEDLTPLSLKLMGVIFSPRGEMAILAESSGKNRRVKRGGTVEGWRLIELKPDHVTLQRGEEKRDLPLIKPRPKGAQTAATPSPQRRLPVGMPNPGRRASHPAMPAVPPPETPTEPNEPDAEEPDDSSDAGDEADGEGEEGGISE